MQQNLPRSPAPPPRSPPPVTAYAEPAGLSHHAARLAAGFRLGAADRDDLRQELRLALVLRRNRYDPERGGPATFAALVLRHAAQDLGDRLARERRLILLPLDAAAFTEATDPFVGVDLRITLEHFAASLPAELLHVWGLLTVTTPADAIRAYGRSRAGFYRAVRELRLRALAAGLGDVSPAETVRRSCRYMTRQNERAVAVRSRAA